MNFQTAMDYRLLETVFRGVQNSITGTTTITARTIGSGTPAVLATNTASLPSSVLTVGQNFIQKPATLTSLVNNLFVGILQGQPANPGYLEGEAPGLAQCYGVATAVVQILTDAQVPGGALVPNSVSGGVLVNVTGPVTAAATGTAANVEVPALGCLAVLLEAVASSSATSTGTARVFLRCM